MQHTANVSQFIHAKQKNPIQYTTDVEEFFRLNNRKLRHMVHSICFKYFIDRSHVDDIVDDLYVKFITKKILLKYNTKYPSASTLGTYLYRVAINVVKAYLSTSEVQIERRRFNPEFAEATRNNYYNQYDEVESAYNLGIVDYDYTNNTRTNHISDSIDGINLDLNLFEKFLAKRNRVYSHVRSRTKVRKENLSLLSLFRLMRSGYTNRAIANIYGVSEMWITTLKTEIKYFMKEYGITWGSIEQLQGNI